MKIFLSIIIILYFGCTDHDLGTSDTPPQQAGTQEQAGAQAPQQAGTQEQADIQNRETCPDDLPWINVPIRFHLLESNIATLNATMNASDIQNVMQEVRTYWTQACIDFEIESVIKNRITQAQEMQFETRLADNPTPEERRAIMRDVMPTSDLLSPGWNVMVFPLFAAPATGIYITDIKSVLWSENLPDNGPIDDNPPIILAHELGHSFGLLHYTGSDKKTNLMNADIMREREVAELLTVDQIQQARQQAQLGEPAL